MQVNTPVSKHLTDYCSKPDYKSNNLNASNGQLHDHIRPKNINSDRNSRNCCPRLIEIVQIKFYTFLSRMTHAAPPLTDFHLLTENCMSATVITNQCCYCYIIRIILSK